MRMRSHEWIDFCTAPLKRIRHDPFAEPLDAFNKRFTREWILSRSAIESSFWSDAALNEKHRRQDARAAALMNTAPFVDERAKNSISELGVAANAATLSLFVPTERSAEIYSDVHNGAST